MKKRINIIIAFFILVTLIFVAPKNRLALAETASSELKINVISREYTGEGAYSFTPFDTEAGARMAGASFKPTTNADGSFEATINFESSQYITRSLKMSLNFWAYFSSKKLLNLTFILKGETAAGENLVLSKIVASGVLKQMLSKNIGESIDISSDGYAWNRIAIPLNIFTDESGKFLAGEGVKLNSLTIKFDADDKATDTEFSKLYLFDTYIKADTFSDIAIIKKQPFRLVKFDFLTSAQLNNVYFGDTLTLKTHPAIIKYAWIGETNVKENIAAYTTRATVIDGEENEANWDFNSTFTFNTEGRSIVKFEILSGSTQVLYEAFTLDIAQFRALTFVSGLTQFVEGKTVRIYLNKNQKLTALDNVKFSVSGDCARIKSTNVDEMYVDVELLTSGDFTLTVTGKGSRENQAEFNIELARDYTVTKKQTVDNTGKIVALWVALGCFAAVGLGFGIKAIVDANKYKVR